jgi:hypothetical protein
VQDKICNGDEMVILEVSATKTSFQNIMECTGHKLNKARITVLCCVNISDSHKLKLCVTGKAKKLHSFKGTENTKLLVTYFSHKESFHF